MAARLLRRALDLLLAGGALLLLAAPLVAVAVWIRLDSPGPALFRHERIGRGGRPFDVLKFRTMAMRRPDAAGPELTAADDPRITRAGAWLRRSKVDELPQLWNVLRGEMSLVGPRPEVARYVALWPQPLRERLLAVRPGLTDPASIAFADEQERLAAAADPEREYLQVIAPAKLRLSAEYLARRTVASDLAVMVGTVRRLWR